MNKLSQPVSFRRLTGSCSNHGDYVPIIRKNEDYVFESRCFTILHTKCGGKSFTRNSLLRSKLLVKRAQWFQTNYGLSKHQSMILVSRRVTDIKRIEETIHGIVDSLLLFDLELFKEGSPGRRILHNIVRKILIIGTYNVGQIVQYWKELCSFLYNRLAGLLPPLPIPSLENFFYRQLSDWGKIRRILSQDVDKYLLESFAHIYSTRQLPAAGRKEEKESLRVFFSNIEAPFILKKRTRETLISLSERIGEKCISLSDKIITRPHISLSCAGSYYQTILEGGRGKEIRDALNRILTVCPEDNESIETPFGLLCCPKGEPRWRHWCREYTYVHYPDISFGDVIIYEELAKLHPYYQGFDEAIGSQILVCAYLDYTDWCKTGCGIPCRVLTVPEPGFKARIVTTGPYWLNVLQQGLSHVLKDILSGHPSVRSSLQKTDQAWQSLYLMSNKEYPSDFFVLSSDLKEATDNIPKEVAKLLVEGFCKGSGVQSNLITPCLHLLEMNREFISSQGLSVSQTRGVMMGEPLTKVILTLLNLVVEEYAMRHFLKLSSKTSFFDSPSWRTYHVGGDDHLAIGPKEYLQRITIFHTALGSKISEGKHGMSRVAVRYCEKVIDVRNIYKPFDVRRINDSTECYEASPFVDSIKVRLLSPTSKSFDVVADRNVAIGKGLSLGRTLKWLNRDHFPTKWVKMIRNRFFQRMGSLLPDRTSGVFWQLMLPSYWGGLNLYLDDEVETLYSKTPELTKSVMESYILEEPSAFKDVELLSKFLTNYSYRGYRLNETEVQAITTYFKVVLTSLPVMTWKEVKQEFDPKGEMSAKALSELCYKEGWHAEPDIVDELLRPILFKEILLGKEKPSPYNTVRLKTRYAKLWDLIYRGPSKITLRDFEKALKVRPSGNFYKVGYPEELYFVSDRGYLYTSVLDDALRGMPVLNIGYPYS